MVGQFDEHGLNYFNPTLIFLSIKPAVYPCRFRVCNRDIELFAPLCCLQRLRRLKTLGINSLITSAAFCAHAAPLGSSLTAFSYYGGGILLSRRCAHLQLNPARI